MLIHRGKRSMFYKTLHFSGVALKICGGIISEVIMKSLGINEISGISMKFVVH